MYLKCLFASSSYFFFFWMHVFLTVVWLNKLPIFWTRHVCVCGHHPLISDFLLNNCQLIFIFPMRLRWIILLTLSCFIITVNCIKICMYVELSCLSTIIFYAGIVCVLCMLYSLYYVFLVVKQLWYFLYAKIACETFEQFFEKILTWLWW